MKKLTLKQALLKLPEIDKRWETTNIPDHHYATFTVNGKIKLMIDWYFDNLISINELHAAAKTIKCLIYSIPERHPTNTDKWMFIPCWREMKSMGKQEQLSLKKEEVVAIYAAFIATIMYKTKGTE